MNKYVRKGSTASSECPYAHTESDFQASLPLSLRLGQDQPRLSNPGATLIW